ncbi:MAG: hypothetical protein Q4F83_12185 [Eubacteriales bacterium]|nr:hypothetical protein [Eubacteriales bacterium]
MEDYKPNSHKSKEERETSLPEKKVEKIVSGSVKSKKKNGIQKITDVFIPEDVENVKTYVFEDVIVPAVKDIILDTVRAFLGIDKKTGRNSNASKVAYRSYYDKDNRRDSNATRIRTGYDFDDIILDNRGEAEDVLARMDELIDTYGLVSVADFYDLVGVSGNYTDNKYGWSNIRSASVIRVRDGYMIKLPKALPLN